MRNNDNCIQLHMGINKKDKFIFIVIILLIFSVCQFGIKQICGFTIYPDEFGYWASAAKIVGWDWSEVASLGSYYSFGYSVLLVPALYFAPDSVSAYQLAIFVNMLLMGWGYVLLCIISEKIFKEMSRIIRYLASGVAVLYPAWIFYMKMTLTEALLLFLFLLVIYGFIQFLQKPRLLTGGLLAVILVYFYIVHMRTVGTIVACGITLFLWGISERQNRKYVFIILGLTIIAFIGAFYIKELVQQSVYTTATAEELAVNDYAGKLGNIKYIFTVEGCGSLVSHLAGKIVYWGVASLGLVYWAFAWMIRQIMNLVKRIKGGQEIITVEWLAIFLFLASLAQVTVSSLYYIKGRSIDVYMNGRYIDFLVPILVVIGLYHLYTNSRRWRKTAVFSFIHIGLTILTAITIWGEETQRIRGYHQVGIIWLLNYNEMNIRSYLIKIALVGVVFLIITALFMWLIRKREVYIWILSLFMFLEILIAEVASIRYVYSSNDINFRERALVSIVEEKCNSDAEIYYLDDGSDQWIDFIQMQLREQSIRVITEKEWKKKKEEIDILFTTNNESNMETYSTQFDRCVDESLLILFYNTDDEGK